MHRSAPRHSVSRGLVLRVVAALLFASGARAGQGPLPEAPAPPPVDVAPALGPGWAELREWARGAADPLARRAVEFLAAHAPARDAGLDAELLRETVTLALAARARFPWAAAVPEELFLNDVLPYAVLDETRERWRPRLLEVAAPLVAGARTLEEAAQALNAGLFDAVDVHYHTGRKRPNQSPSESIEQSIATCTGLSILLVDACRAVGVPARAAGVASWFDKRGNHTWVEVWDGARWRFTGADEHDPQGLDRGWFTGDAAQAVPGNARYAVWASSWRATGAAFPLSWAPRDRSVHGVDVTARYAAPPGTGASELALASLRLWDREGGERLVGEVVVRDAAGAEVARETTRAGRADLNDMPALRLAPGTYALAVTVAGATRTCALALTDAGARTVDLRWDTLAPAAPSPDASTSAGGTPAAHPVDAEPLSRAAAEALVRELWAAQRAALEPALRAELEAQAFVLGEHTLRVKEKRFGDAPEGRRSLWLSLHGGGGAPARVNDQQWENQIRLYEPEEGYYVAPRAPTDTWNLWHQGHIDPLFQRLIDAYVVVRGVDPERVYVLGYSAGGDGVYQLAPRMADRFAAAAMMAGHPNESQPLALRNLPFMLFMGGKDGAYDRNKVAEQYGARLDALAAADPGGYPHLLTIYPECGHWMNGQDRSALPWMAARVRATWPERVVWHQDDVVHTRFYWLEVPPEEAVAGRTVTATVTGQTVTVEAPDTAALTLRLSDALLDLDQEIVVRWGGREAFRGRVPRTREAVEASLASRADPTAAATALLPLRR